MMTIPTDHATLRRIATAYSDLLLPPYCDMVNVDGFDALCAFMTYYGSALFYVPSLRTILTPAVKADVIARHNGFNALELAQQYGYHLTTIWKWLKAAK